MGATATGKNAFEIRRSEVLYHPMMAKAQGVRLENDASPTAV